MMLGAVSVVSIAVGTSLLFLTVALTSLFRFLRHLPSVQKGTVAFFHPFADGGGGGERVLWCAVQAVQRSSPNSLVVIYVQTGPTAETLMKDALNRFNIQVEKPIQVVPLPSAFLVLPERYPRFTLIMQAIGSIRLGYQALHALVPEVFIDTTGWAFTYPLARWAGSRVACYTHYPIVSTNMLSRVWDQQAGYNNDKAISGSGAKTLLKVLYYQLLAYCYGFCGGCAHVTMVNSSWTKGHVQQLWWWRRGVAASAILVYPPVDTEHLRQLPLDRRLKHLFLVSVAQFRPEKNHRLQLEAYALARQGVGTWEASALTGPAATSALSTTGAQSSGAVSVSRLKMVGSCRNASDVQRLQALQQYATELGVAEHVDWLVNVPYSELRALLGGAVGGLHTMVDEHFGISVVEYMAAGAIPIAHASGGPKADIVVSFHDEKGEEQKTGFLATTVEEYAEAITQVLVMSQQERLKIAAAAQQHVAKFSTERFTHDFTAAVIKLLP